MAPGGEPVGAGARSWSSGRGGWRATPVTLWFRCLMFRPGDEARSGARRYLVWFTRPLQEPVSGGQVFVRLGQTPTYLMFVDLRTTSRHGDQPPSPRPLRDGATLARPGPVPLGSTRLFRCLSIPLTATPPARSLCRSPSSPCPAGTRASSVPAGPRSSSLPLRSLSPSSRWWRSS